MAFWERYLLWVLWYITNCDILGGKPFLGPSSFLCPIEKIWRIDCHNFPTKGTNKINIFVLIIAKTDVWSKERKLSLKFCRKGNFFIAPHLSLYWTSCHKSHLNSKERGHKDENWKATHPPSSCPKVLKSAQVLKIAKVLLGQKMFRLLVGCWRPTSNWGPPSHPQATPLLSLPPPSASLIHGSLHGNLLLIQHLKWNNNQSWSRLLPPSKVYCTFPLSSSSHQDCVCCSKQVMFPDGVSMHMLQKANQLPRHIIFIQLSEMFK